MTRLDAGPLSRWDGVVAGVLATIVGVLGTATTLASSPGAETGDGYEIRSLAGTRRIAASDTIVHVPGPAGGLLLAVSEGRARVVEAACPGRRCLRMGPISRASDPPIQCIPNAVSIRAVGRGGEGRRLDGITG